MTNNVIDRGANGLGESAVIQWRWNGLLMFSNVAVTNVVQFTGRNAGLDIRSYHAQHLGSQLPCHAHLLYVFLAFQCNGHVFRDAEKDLLYMPFAL
jgi:hypothetical protein